MTYALQIETSAPRPGRRFEPIQERGLHDFALGAAEGLPGASRGLVVVPEFAGPIGIPDFTAYVGAMSDLESRHRLAVPPVTNEIDAGIVSAVHVRRVSNVIQIASALGWPVTAIEGRMRRLVITGALIESRRGYFTRPPQIQTRGRLYAIEAKINDWKQALRQVRTYRVWADSYVLVMSPLSERVTAALTTEVFRDRGGLVVDGEWIVRPRIGSTPEHRRLQAAEYFAFGTEHGLCDPSLALRIHS